MPIRILRSAMVVLAVAADSGGGSSTGWSGCSFNVR